MKRFPWTSVLAAMAIAIVLLTYMITYQVRFSDAAVKIRFGKVQQVVREPGLYMKWPAPIDRVKTYDTRLRVLDTNESEIKTRDGQNIIVGCYALWRVAKPETYCVRVENDQVAEQYVRDRVNEARAKVIGRHNLSEFVSLEREVVDQNFDAIQREMLEMAAPGVLADYGVELKGVRIRRFALPEGATQTVQEAMRQERERLAARYKTEGEALRDAIKARAENARKTIMDFAARKAQEVQSAGVNASTRIIQSIDKEDQEFFIWLRYMEALEAALAQKTTIFMDANTDIFKTFAQPEDLLGRTPPNPPAAADKPAQNATPPAATQSDTPQAPADEEQERRG